MNYSTIMDTHHMTVHKAYNIEIFVGNTKQPLALFIIGTVSTILNLLVIISCAFVIKEGKLSKSTYLFLGNLAFADFLLSAVVAVINFIFKYSLRAHPAVYNTIDAIMVGSNLESAFTIALIAIDRYLYILHGLHYQKWLNTTNATISLIVTWCIGLGFGFLKFVHAQIDTFPASFDFFVYVFAITAVLMFVPLVTVIVLYSIILYKALVKVSQLKKATSSDPKNKVTTADGLRILKKPSAEPSSSGESSGAKKFKGFKHVLWAMQLKKGSNADKAHHGKGPKKRKSIIMVMLVTVCSLITWGPLISVKLAVAYCARRRFECDYVEFFTPDNLHLCYLTGGILNPIIYAWWHPGFRDFSLRKVLHFCATCCKNGSDESVHFGKAFDYESTNTTTTSTTTTEWYATCESEN